MHSVVIMFCGPFYGAYPYHFGRIDRAIALSRAVGCPLVICGDGTDGRELEAFLARARHAGAPLPIARYNGKRNTQGDAVSAVSVIAAEFPDARRAYLVTDWYHLPRSAIRLARALRRRCLDYVAIMPAPVWDHLRHGLWRLPWEIIGCWYALARFPLPPKRRKGSALRRPSLRRLLGLRRAG